MGVLLTVIVVLLVTAGASAQPTWSFDAEEPRVRADYLSTFNLPFASTMTPNSRSELVDLTACSRLVLTMTGADTTASVEDASADGSRSTVLPTPGSGSWGPQSVSLSNGYLRLRVFDAGASGGNLKAECTSYAKVYTESGWIDGYGENNLCSGISPSACVQVPGSGSGDLSADLQTAINALLWPGGTLTTEPIVYLGAPTAGDYDLDAEVIICGDTSPPSGATVPDCTGTETLPEVHFVGDWDSVKMTPSGAHNPLTRENNVWFRIGDVWKIGTVLTSGAVSLVDGLGWEVTVKTVDTNLRFGTGPNDSFANPSGSFGCFGCAGDLSIVYEEGGFLLERAPMLTGEGMVATIETPLATATAAAQVMLGGNGGATISAKGRMALHFDKACTLASCARIMVAPDTNIITDGVALYVNAGEVFVTGGRFATNATGTSPNVVTMLPRTVGDLKFIQLSGITVVGGPNWNSKSVINFDGNNYNPDPSAAEMADEKLWPRAFVSNVTCINPNTATGTGGDSAACIGGRSAAVGSADGLPYVIDVDDVALIQGLPDRKNSLDPLGQDQIANLSRHGRHLSHKANFMRHTNEQPTVLSVNQAVTPASLPQCVKLDGTGLAACGTSATEIPSYATRYWISRWNAIANSAITAGVDCRIHLLLDGVDLDDFVSTPLQQMTYNDASGDFAAADDWLSFWIEEPQPRDTRLEVVVNDDGSNNCNNIDLTLEVWRAPIAAVPALELP